MLPTATDTGTASREMRQSSRRGPCGACPVGGAGAGTAIACSKASLFDCQWLKSTRGCPACRRANQPSNPGVFSPPTALASAGRPGNVNPAGSCVERARRGAVECDRSTGSVSPHQIDHLLEQFELIFVPHAAADDDARLRVPGPGNPVRIEPDHEDSGCAGAVVSTCGILCRRSSRAACQASARASARVDRLPGVGKSL
jgi:hypothetical protein